MQTINLTLLLIASIFWIYIGLCPWFNLKDDYILLQKIVIDIGCILILILIWSLR